MVFRYSNWLPLLNKDFEQKVGGAFLLIAKAYMTILWTGSFYDITQK